MPQAIVDPSEIRRFAHNLKKFSAELQDQVAVLHKHLHNLGATWRDQEHQKFKEEFEQAMQAMSRFVAATDEHVPFLLRKADRVEEYLQQR